MMQGVGQDTGRGEEGGQARPLGERTLGGSEASQGCNSDTLRRAADGRRLWESRGGETVSGPEGCGVASWRRGNLS